MIEFSLFETMLGMINSNSLSEQNVILTLNVLQKVVENQPYFTKRLSKLMSITSLFRVLDKRYEDIILYFILIISKLGKDFILTFRSPKKRVYF